MVVVITEGKLTENKKQTYYKYGGIFKLINRISKLTEELENIDQYMTYNDIEYIGADTKEINKILDKIENRISKCK